MPTDLIIQVLFLSIHTFLKGSKELKYIHLLVVVDMLFGVPQDSVLRPLLPLYVTSFLK